MSKKYKIGSATAVSAAAADGVIEINPTESLEIVSIDLDANASIKLGADAAPQIGSQLVLKVSSDATARNLTFGAGFSAPTLTGVIDKTKTITLVYDGTSYIATAASVQID